MSNNNRLPLDVIQVAEPCPESWEDMSGDDRVRYCAGCRKHVYNLSAMTRTEAERLVCEGAGSLCVRFARSETGQVRTLEYRAPAGKKRGWRFWTIVSACAASVVAGVNGYLLARGKPAPAAPAFIVGELMPPAPTAILGKPGMPMVMGMVAMPPATLPAAPAPQQPLSATDATETAAG